MISRSNDDDSRHETRVILFLRSLELGGAERQAVLLANELHTTDGYTIQVWSFSPGSRVSSMLDPGIQIRVINPGGGCVGPRRLRRLGLFISSLRNARPDILIPYTDWPNKAVGAIWPLTGAKACIWNQRDEGREVTGGFMERRALKQASWFVANSRSGIDFLRERMGVDRFKISSIHNAVVPIRAQHTGNHWRERLSIEPTKFVATMMASLSQFKDHATLLAAWPEVRNASPGAVLLLAGKDSDQGPEVRDLAAKLKGVRILGEVDDVGGLLEASDALVHSSAHEGTPNAVLEAMAAGLPVVANDIPGTREALGPDRRWLVPVNDSAALATALVELARDPQLRLHVGGNNKAHAIDLFSPEKVSRAWLEIIQALLQGQRPKPSDTPG